MGLTQASQNACHWVEVGPPTGKRRQCSDYLSGLDRPLFRRTRQHPQTCTLHHLDMTSRRAALIVGAALGAVLIGGVAQTYGWRWRAEGVAKVTNSQFTWMLLCFVVAWALAPARVSWGMVAGGSTGLGLIASYYCVQWFADGWHAAASQFGGAYGFAWTVGATGGGALVGGLGALAGSSAKVEPVRKAFGLSTAALVVGLGPLVWFMTNNGVLVEAGMWAAVIFYGAWSDCCWRYSRCGSAGSPRSSAVLPWAHWPPR